MALEAVGINICPQKLKEDLILEIEGWWAQGERLIFIIDINKNMSNGKLITMLKSEKLKMLDIVCLKDILVNGALAGLPTVLLFLVIFILLCIPPMVDKIAK